MKTFKLLLLLFLTSCIGANYYADLPSDKFELSCSANKCNWTMDIKSTEDITMAHLHCNIGIAPMNGPIGVPLFHGALQYSGTFTPDDFTKECGWKLPIGMDTDDRFNLFYADLDKGNIYFNIHTKQHPAGLIQGVMKKKGIFRSLKYN